LGAGGLDDPRSPNTLASPFRTIVENEVLDQNVFSIKLPRNDSRLGDIMFGGSNEELFDAESLVYHPLHPESTTQWQGEASGVSLAKAGSSMKEQSILLSDSSKSYSALITASPVLGFPRAIGEALLAQLPLEQSSCGGEVVTPCSEVPNLPDLIISFSGDQEVVVKGSDYVAEMILPWCKDPVVECMPLIDAIPENIPGIVFPPNLIKLGSGLLQSLYSVWDWDEKRVGRECFSVAL
jgi:hypothetical protein